MNILYRIYFKFEKIINKRRMKGVHDKLLFCGTNVIIDGTCHIIMPQRMEIGDNTSISSYTTIYATYGVKIGKNCLISSNCGISSYNHIINSSNRHRDVAEDIKYSKPVVIGDNVWIGMNACILPGVKIGDDSIIGSGSVVTKNVPPREIWAGNPARCIKSI
ncbi:acetyltransferase-like isoleucine patch superfamily enzyme [Hymenobacter sp. 9A]|uniref:Acetyltransferase-like isoleucine patch superfamily enzyme n=1 Tax=Hymenobacter caeli TaxID=2735894 RepID=A0ABX2FUI9_9BACT|nr:acyltransferase [Hymenobacter caeli]NRT20166.1 acetyltransferase-like isoleucine patch superfamily enzyme [Hymenobacter caeli]